LAASEWLRNELRSQNTRTCDINAIVPVVVESLFVPSHADLIAQAVRVDREVVARRAEYKWWGSHKEA